MRTRLDHGFVLVVSVASAVSVFVSVVVVLSAEVEFNRLNCKPVVPVKPGTAYEGRTNEARKGEAARRNVLGSIFAGRCYPDNCCLKRDGRSSPDQFGSIGRIHRAFV